MEIIVASEHKGGWCKDFLTHILKITYGEHILIKFENHKDANLLIRGVFPMEGPFKKDNIPYITWSGEPFEPTNRKYPPLFSVWNPSVTNKFIIPFLVVAFFELQNFLQTQFNLDDLRLGAFEKPYFLAYCYTRTSYVREAFFKAIREYDPNSSAHGLGPCQKTTDYSLLGTWTHMVEAYKPYRFVVAMENTGKRYYVTEKLLNALLAGAIPIYWGDPIWVKKVFNPKCIIFLQDFKTIQECVEYVYKVDRTPELYQEYVNQPRFVNTKGLFDLNDPCDEYLEMKDIIKNNVRL